MPNLCNMFLKKIILIVTLTFSLKTTFAQNADKPFHTNTVWILLSSVKFDAFCLLNTLMGDEFYVKNYPKIYKHYDSLFTSVGRKSLNDLKQYKNKRGMILSAFLCN